MSRWLAGEMTTIKNDNYFHKYMTEKTTIIFTNTRLKKRQLFSQIYDRKYDNYFHKYMTDI